MEYLQLALKLSGLVLIAFAFIMMGLLGLAMRIPTRYGVGGLNGKVRSTANRKEKG
jgi:hypothetical protein